MARQQYLDDPEAPVARGLLPAAFAIVRNDQGQVLLVRRADDGNWEAPGGRIDVGESAVEAVVREVAEESGVDIEVIGLSGVYSDPGHVLAYPGGAVYQQVAICFHARAAFPERARPDGAETTAARWFEPPAVLGLPMHPTMRRRLTDALGQPAGVPHFD